MHGVKAALLEAEAMAEQAAHEQPVIQAYELVDSSSGHGMDVSGSDSE